MLSAMENPSLYGGRVPTSSSMAGGEFAFDGNVEVVGPHSDDGDVQHDVFWIFPELWSFSMQEVYMALYVTRLSDRWVSSQELSSWTGLTLSEVIQSLLKLQRGGKVKSDNGLTWKCDC